VKVITGQDRVDSIAALRQLEDDWSAKGATLAVRSAGEIRRQLEAAEAVHLEAREIVRIQFAAGRIGNYALVNRLAARFTTAA
jgi:hypothetical protein